MKKDGGMGGNIWYRVDVFAEPIDNPPEGCGVEKGHWGS